jgi:ABC-type nitrate/sulfonate/bicarbonate transport system substrate-binding protein
MMVAATGLMLTACVSNGGTSKSKSGATQVTFAIQVAAPPSASVYLADSLGYFKQQGIDVKITIVANNYLQLATGKLHYGIVGTTQLIQAAAHGTGLQQICPTVSTPNYVLAVSQSTLDKHHITASTSLKDTLAALDGERVAEIGGATNPGAVLLRTLLTKNGLSPDSIKVISQTSTASSTASFANGQVGLVFQPQPVPDLVLSKVPGRIVYQTKGSDVFGALDGAPWTGVVGPTSYLSKNPDLNKKICTAVAQANNYLLAHPEQAAAKLQPAMSSFSTKQLEDGLAAYSFMPDAAMSKPDFEDGVKQLVDYGLVEAPSTEVLDKAYTTAYQG